MPEEITARRNEDAPAKRPRRRATMRPRDTRLRDVIAGIERKIPTYDPVAPGDMELIELHVDLLLKEVGIEFRGDPEAIDLWRRAGADVGGETVRFEAGMLRQLIQATTPRSFTQHARNPARSVMIGGDRVVFAPAYGAPFVRDEEHGRRYGTMTDFENFVKLASATPWLHHSGGTVCEPVDVPVNKRHLDMVYAHMRHSDKPFMGSVTSAERAEDSIAMARLVFGTRFVDENCVIMGNINVNSPLTYDAAMSGSLRAYARANQCPVVVPFILAGATGPVASAGALVLSLAEAMAGVALGQLERPGSPAVFGNFLTTTTLRTGTPTFGMPEPFIASLAAGQFARSLGVPLRCSGGFTSSKIPDAQAAHETTLSFLTALLSGANFVLHTAGWLESALVMSYEKFILDVDAASSMHTLLSGLDLSANGFAMDAFREVSPGSHFFGCAHTLANYKTAFHEPDIADVAPFEVWHERGETSASDRASVRWKSILERYESPAMDSAVDEALRAFMAKRKEGLPDIWH
jgi:trimethylamine--corrinoid protein Co-methyltransferase